MAPNNTELKIRLNKLEDMVEKHLQESGEIRTDLAWIKKALWSVAAAGLTFNVTLAIYLLTHSK